MKKEKQSGRSGSFNASTGMPHNHRIAANYNQKENHQLLQALMADTSKMWVEEPLISVIHFLILVIFIKESEFIAGLELIWA